MSLQDRLVELANQAMTEYDTSNTDWDTFYETT
jgi:hypothetical protein